MKKQTAAIILAIIGVVATAIGGSGSATNWTFDFSTTNIGQIGDINTFIQNNLGINLDEFKAMCDRGEIDEEFEKYCRLIP